MGGSVRGWLAGTVLLGVLACAGAASGSNYDSPESLWEHYCKMVGLRDEVEVLACYEEKLRTQLVGDKTAAGRARLNVHMSEMFELLFRDYDYTVADEKQEGDKVTYTVKFAHRKKHTNHTATVGFYNDGDRWFVTKPPETPGFMQAGTGTVTMIAGVVVALIAIGIVAKKMLGS